MLTVCFDVTLLLPIRMGNSTVGIGVDMSSGKLALDTCLFFLPIRLSSNLIRTTFGEYVSSSGSGVGRNPVTTPAAELTKPSITSISKSKEA